MRSIATDPQLWHDRSIHAAYCYRRAAVAWSIHPRGLLLQTRSSGVVGQCYWGSGRKFCLMSNGTSRNDLGDPESRFVLVSRVRFA